MSPRKRAVLTVTASALVAIAGVVGIRTLALSDEPQRLAGAELLAAGGDQMLTPLRVRDVPDDLTLDDIRVSFASLLMAGTDDSLLVLVEPLDSAVVRASSDGTITDVGSVELHSGMSGESPAATTDVALGPDGQVAMALVSREVLVRGFGGWTTINDFDARFDVSAMAFTEDDQPMPHHDDDTVLLGSDDGRIDAVRVDDTVRRLLGPPQDPEAEVQWDQPPGPFVSLVPLPDDRVAFVADTPDGYRLHLLGDGEVRPVETDLPNPVRGVQAARPEPGHRSDRLPMEPLAPAPDGRLLATGLGPDGDPRISLVDVDSGEVEVLAELEGIEPTVERPISATIVDDDLVFLADGRIWKLENALRT